MATAQPMSCITMNIGADEGRMPAKLSVRGRATVAAGLANEVDDVNQYAPVIQAPTANWMNAWRWLRTSANTTSRRPTMATCTRDMGILR